MKNDILIAYYSWHGNTKKIAEQIQSKTGGVLFEAAPVNPYTTDYGDTVKHAKEEIYSGFLPDLKTMPEGDSFKTIFVGTPIWWHTMAPPLAAFISSFDMKNKTVIPFSTHGGGGAGSFERDVVAMCPDSTVLKGFVTYHDGGNSLSAELDSWLKSIEII